MNRLIYFLFNESNPQYIVIKIKIFNGSKKNKSIEFLNVFLFIKKIVFKILLHVLMSNYRNKIYQTIQCEKFYKWRSILIRCFLLPINNRWHRILKLVSIQQVHKCSLSTVEYFTLYHLISLIKHIQRQKSEAINYGTTRCLLFTAAYMIRCVRRMSAETQLSASEGKVADIGGVNILKRGRLQHLLTLNDLHSL